jgi:pimeloyl-ACP methyl ester carboxylesterase
VSGAVGLRDRWFEREGVRIHAVEAGPEDGPLYILLHGFPEFWYGWRKQIPALAAAGYRVLAPDQRGYNLSSKPSGASAYAMPELVADVMALAEGHRFRLAGHDWGAAVAWSVALMHPNGVERLTVLNVPHPTVMMRHLLSDPGQMLRSWYMFFFQLPFLPEMAFRATGRQSMLRTSRPGTFSEDDLARYSESWSQPGSVTAMINWYRALFRRPTRPPANPRVEVPTTVIWGKHDAFLKEAMAAESVKLCQEGELVLLDATHWVQHEQPDRVNEVLLRAPRHSSV